MAAYENWTLEIEFTTGVWTDLTSRVITWNEPLRPTVGDTAEASGDSGGFSIELDNSDQALTPGNTLSDFYPNVVTGKAARIRETIGYSTFEHAFGYVDFPEIDAWTESSASSPRAQSITIPAVDTLAQQASHGDVFESALSEYILYNGGNDLVGYWPLTDESAPFLGVGPVLDPIVVSLQVTGTGGTHEEPQPQTGAAPVGSEGSGIRCDLSTRNGGAGYAWVRLDLPTALALATIPVGTTDSVTIAAWYSLGTSPTLSQDIVNFSVDNVGAVYVHRDVTTGVWSLEVAGIMTGTVSLGAVGSDQLLPIAVRISPAAATAELWVGGQRATVNLAGAPAGAMAISSNAWAFQVAYEISHWQIYVGSTWDRTAFLAQVEDAHAPLDGQWTGDRIRTIARYAGIAESELGRIDRGTSRMQPATLAGRTAAELWAEAVETEQGLMFGDGQGQLVFRDRRSIYNV